MDIIAAAVQKGGTGKTTTAAALAQAAAYKGRKVLAIDLDPQGNLTYTLGAEATGNTAFEMLQGERPKLQRTPYGVSVIAASPALATITSGKGSARRLSAALELLKLRYDLIIIDTPPTAGELQYNALMAATGLVIPLMADVYSLQSLYQVLDTTGRIQEVNRDLEIKGLILTQFDGRSTIARQMKDTIEQQAAARGVQLLGTVRAAVAIKEAAALQQSIYEYAPRSKPAQDYLKIYEAL